jgi:UDP-N-acetylmuramyl-tripeptide synthetase
VASALHIEPEVIKDGIQALRGIPGRLEPINTDSGRYVFVDYAHTPDALENAILSLKKIAPARVICIFGCGGDRDHTKRSLMGDIAGRLCDLTIVTSDNPRTENPLAIIDQILSGVRRSGAVQYSPRDIRGGFAKKSFVIEADRRQAIELGIRLASPQDVVLIAGKGHETYQIIGKTTIDFDDRREARKALQRLEKN